MDFKNFQNMEMKIGININFQNLALKFPKYGFQKNYQFMEMNFEFALMEKFGKSKILR